MVSPCHYEIVQPQRLYGTKNKPHIKYGLCMVMMCQCRFISCDDCITVVVGVETWGAHVGPGIYRKLASSAQFYHKLV